MVALWIFRVVAWAFRLEPHDVVTVDTCGDPRWRWEHATPPSISVFGDIYISGLAADERVPGHVVSIDWGESEATP